MIAAEDAAGINTEAASPGSAKSPKGQSKNTPTKQKQAAKAAFTQLSKDEQLERKNLGKLMMLWSVIGSVLIDQFVVKAMIPVLNQGLIGYLPSITTLIVPPIVIYYVLKVYWK